MNQAQILVVDDDVSLRQSICETLQLAGYSVVDCGDGDETLQYLRRHPLPSLVLSDVQMTPVDGLQLLRQLQTEFPKLPVLMMTAFGSVSHAIEALKNGAKDYLLKPFASQSLLEKVQSLELVTPSMEPVSKTMIVGDQSSQDLMRLAQRVALTEATVLIGGESGTGKEVVARFIHEQSKRSNGPFIAINCAAIPENMLEAVLFGYEKGAFTGAYKATPGKFEQAQAGSLLLDEISEMDLGLQAKLLRVLQEREVERLGGGRLFDLDVRVLATTNKVLREEVAAGRFREDLFYRLNVFPLRLLPLRQRLSDLEPLVQYLLARIPAEINVSAQAWQKLRGHTWPGNVRELDNVLQRAVILSNGAQIEVVDIQFETDASLLEIVEIEKNSKDLSSQMRGQEQDMILSTLQQTSGNRKQAAERLGISPRTLRYKLSRMRSAGLSIPS